MDYGLSMTMGKPIHPYNVQNKLCVCVSVFVCVCIARRGRDGERLTGEEVRNNARGRNIGGKSRKQKKGG